MNCKIIIKAANRCVKPFSQKSSLPAPAGFTPSSEWQENQSADFADVRQVHV